MAGEAQAAPRRLLRRPERRRALVAAATRAFARGGYAATSLDDIAAEAGVARDTIYRNYDSKADLYRAALELALENVRRGFERTGADRRLGREGVEALLGVARDDPDGFRLLFHHAAREPEFRPLVDRHRAAMTAVAEAGLRRHIADPARRRWAASLLPAIVVEAIIGWLDAGSPDPERAADLVAEVQRGAIRALRQ